MQIETGTHRCVSSVFTKEIGKQHDAREIFTRRLTVFQSVGSTGSLNCLLSMAISENWRIMMQGGMCESWR
jgi:hypothetical protein